MKCLISRNSSVGIFWEKKNKEEGKKSLFLLEINEMPNEGSIFDGYNAL